MGYFPDALAMKASELDLLLLLPSAGLSSLMHATCRMTSRQRSGGHRALRYLSAPSEQLDGGGAVGNMQLADDRGNTGQYRTGGDHQAAGDLGGRLSLGEQLGASRSRLVRR